MLSAYGYEVPVINSYTKLVDDKASNLKEAFDLSEELSSKIQGQPRKDMEMLEGLMSHASKHAAGILIMNDRVDNHFPVRVDREEGVMVCEWHKKIVEKLGAYVYAFVKHGELVVKRCTI